MTTECADTVTDALNQPKIEDKGIPTIQIVSGNQSANDSTKIAQQTPNYASLSKVTGSEYEHDETSSNSSKGRSNEDTVTPNSVDENGDESFVYHDYRDVSPPSRDDVNCSIWDKRNSIKENNSSNAREPNFPMKLHSILSHPEFRDMISWMPHGRSWRVLKPKAFEERVIPLYFRHGQYSSFARQVNGWGFNRITQGADYNSYYHELFLRGKPFLCERMRRPSCSKKKTIPVEQEPDFYQMPEVHDISSSTGTNNHVLAQTEGLKAEMQALNTARQVGGMNIQIQPGASSSLVNLPGGGIQRVINVGTSMITISGPAAIGADPAIVQSPFSMNNYVQPPVILATHNASMIPGAIQGVHGMPYRAPFTVHRPEVATIGHNEMSSRLRNSGETMRHLSGFNGNPTISPSFASNNIATLHSASSSHAHPAINFANTQNLDNAHQAQQGDITSNGERE